jgi:hypothetical protein
MKVMKRLVIGCPIAAVVFAGLLAQGQAPESAAPPKTVPARAEKSAPSTPEKQSTTDNSATDFWQCVVQGDPAATKRIEQALAAPLHSNGWDFTNQPLKDVVTLLQDEYRIPIQLNTSALEEAGIDPSQKTTISLRGVSLSSALRLMLKQHQLTYVIQDEVLMITTKEDAEKDLILCVYDARKVLADPNDKNIKELVENITECVSTDTWATNGGGQSEIKTLAPGLLIISQTRAVHEEIQALLATIRRVTQGRAVESKPEQARGS